MASSVVISGVEVLSAAMVLVLMRFLTGDPATVDTPLLGRVGERWPSLEDSDLVLIAASVTGALFLARAVVFLVNVHLQFRVAYSAGVRLSTRLTRLYLSMPYRWHLERNSAQLMTNVVEAVNHLVVFIFVPSGSAISNTLLAITLIAVLLLTDAVSTLAGGLFLGGIIFVVLRKVRPQLGALARREIEGYEQSIGAIQEALTGLRDVKMYALEDYAGERLYRGRYKQARANYMRSTLTAVPRVVIETAAVLAMLAFLIVRHENASSQEALATLGVFGYAIIRLLPTVSSLMASVNTVQYGAAAVETLVSEFALVGEDESPTRDDIHLGPTPDLALESVTFEYGSGRTPALKDINVRIGFADSVGIVGPTGSGKSTLLDVMAGLLDPTEGRVLAGGVPLPDCRRAWQRRLGVVPQTIVLTNDTLAANIAIGVAPDEVNQALLLQAVEQSQLAELISHLPDGLNTEVGERGVRLSGGQRQRVAIARALYPEPSVLIFDEGTAALDSATEADLMDAVKRLRGSMTLIMVAHRLATVRFCDRILLVEDGHITGDGGFDELARECLGFQRLIQES